MVRESLWKDLWDDEPTMEEDRALLARTVASREVGLYYEIQSKVKVTRPL